ncbi:hypothetical protein B0A50_05836 [Salinomyces thailandicus]|uniref:Uncharacterized protein n=1 Tax=Salinomyces thailandicus TaxID=706561 RepID=A0A4V5N406_9PEZI|nr:hypothetical protein B0A50_05836 [Salinomyces thailandica]
MPSDEKLGITIGVSAGAVALIVLAVSLCCLRRRRKAIGTYHLQRQTPSVTESDIESWRSPDQPEFSTRVSASRNEATDEKYAPASLQERPAPPPLSMHPAFARHSSTQSTSERNPLCTPHERAEQHETEGLSLNHPEMDGMQAPQTATERKSTSSIRETEYRPPTPFSPMPMLGLTFPQHYVPDRPFPSHIDGKADDAISPNALPARSPERGHSPMVHYPSWSEISEFDFTGERNERASLRDQCVGEDDGRDWRRGVRQRESVVGRHELA